MNVPEAAIEAAAQAMRGIGPSYTFDSLARAAIEAAMPAIREAIAQEIERTVLAVPSGGPTKATAIAQATAARIVRGGAA